MEFLKQLHGVEQEILDEIDRICTKNNLTYFLVGGTLLGAIRHKGFIPWDDDLDIAMAREDYNKFIEICKSELDNKYVLHYFNTDENYWLTFAKIRKKHTLYDEEGAVENIKYKGMWVDIFPLDYLNSKDGFKAVFKEKILYRLKEYIVLFADSRTHNPSSLKNKIKLCCFKCLGLDNVRLSYLYEFIASGKKKSNYLVNYGSQYGMKKQTMPVDKYFPPKKVEFEGKFYLAPADPDFVLTQIYGKDYMQLPPLEKRKTHNPKAISFDYEEE